MSQNIEKFNLTSLEMAWKAYIQGGDNGVRPTTRSVILNWDVLYLPRVIISLSLSFLFSFKLLEIDNRSFKFVKEYN